MRVECDSLTSFFFSYDWHDSHGKIASQRIKLIRNQLSTELEQCFALSQLDIRKYVNCKCYRIGFIVFEEEKKMAEKAAELVTREDKIARAKELYARGYRNYVVGDFNEAAEDLSRSSELYAELFGDESEEVAIPNLFYGKTLIELAQMGENKVLALPDQQEEEDDDENSEEQADGDANADENDEDDDDDDEDESEKNDNVPMIEKKAENTVNNGAGGSSGAGPSSSSSSEPQPSTSSGIQSQNGNGNGNGDIDSGEAEANENLQFAWEALEMAAKIFRRLGVGYEEYLAEAHYGLGEILMENQNCAEAIRDYNIAFEMFSKSKPIKERCLAEIKYKTGLCHYSAMAYDTSIADFQQSADFLQQAIDALKAKDQTADVQQTIDDLSKMREDILIKIADVQETKQLLRSNLITKGGYGALLSEDAKADKPAPSSSNEQSEKPKATDISHLIKRKKPETSTEAANITDASPAKKPAL